MKDGVKIDISALQINQSKMLADGQAYFRLFEKHIPRNLDKDFLVLLYEINNLSCIKRLIDLNLQANYVVVTNFATAKALKVILAKNIDIQYLDELDFKECSMKFDCIVMNPPYQRNLHLKILAEAIKHLKDGNSTCVNLSPVRWLQDPLAKYKKSSDLKRFEESVAKHIESLDTIHSNKANDEFKAGIMTDLGVYVCKRCITNKDFSTSCSIVDKVIIAKTMTLYDVVEYKKRNGVRWQISELQPINAQGGAKGTYGWYRRFCIYNHLRSTIYVNGLKDGKDWTEYTSGITPDKTKTRLIPWSIPFSTVEEAENFENSLKTNFYKYYVLQVKSDQHTPFKFLPFLGDVINPRTGLKGYHSEWTDECFYKYFNITPEEQKVIEDTMAKYK